MCHTRSLAPPMPARVSQCSYHMPDDTSAKATYQLPDDLPSLTCFLMCVLTPNESACWHMFLRTSPVPCTPYVPVSDMFCDVILLWVVIIVHVFVGVMCVCTSSFLSVTPCCTNLCKYVHTTYRFSSDIARCTHKQRQHKSYYHM